MMETGDIIMVTGRFRTLALAACIGMLLVLLGGALVTNTDSGRGCGDDWPLCHGKFVPSYTLESLIEYSHRLVTSFEGILVAAALVSVYRKFKKNRQAFKEPLFYAGGAMLFTIIQALMGAAAVKWPQSPPVMAIHFGISLIAFAATFLLVIWCFRVKNGPVPIVKVPRSIFPRVLLTSIYCYIVVYLGAYIRHTDSGGGCEGWPLCNGEIVPEINGATGVVFIHRVAALLLAIFLTLLFLHIRKVSKSEAGLTKQSAWTLGLVITQIFSGALLTVTITNPDVFIFTNLLHNLIVTGLFGILMDILVRSWRLREGSKL